MIFTHHFVCAPKRLIVFLCLCLTPQAPAKLGETVPQLVQRFGNSYKVEVVELGKTYNFRSANISVDVLVVNGRSASETYLSDHPLTASGEPPNDIVRAILKTNVPKVRWAEIEAAPFGADYALRSSDGQYVAILKYTGPQPENIVWTMTVGLATSVRAASAAALSSNSSPSPLLTSSPSAPVPQSDVPASAEKLESALINLRNDNRRYNCKNAYQSLMADKEDPDVVDFLRSKLATERDLQARGAMLSVLGLSKAYDHDKEFAMAILSYLTEYAEECHRDPKREKGGPHEEKYNRLFRCIHRIDLDCAKFLIRNGKKYENLLQAHFDTGPIMTRWVVAHALSRYDLLNKYKSKANDEYYRVVFSNLRNDKEKHNALYASRILVMLGEHSVPFIRANLLKQRIDPQEGEICRKILDGVSKPRNYAYFRINIGDLDSDVWDWDKDDYHFQYELPIFSKLANIDTSAFEDAELSRRPE
jgi:hypothetical protein